MSDTSAAAPLNFEAALAELESTVQQLESGKLPLDEALAAYRRGAVLIRHCQSQLADAEQQIQVLEGDVLRPLPPPAS